jgi:hypothetical protein
MAGFFENSVREKFMDVGLSILQLRQPVGRIAVVENSRRVLYLNLYQSLVDNGISPCMKATDTDNRLRLVGDSR